jgi:hypothetical protein
VAADPALGRSRTLVQIKRTLNDGNGSRGVPVPFAEEFDGAGDEHWRELISPETPRFDLPRSAGGQRRLSAQIRSLPAGTVVALRCAAPGSRGRCHRFAKDAEIVPVAEYLALPSLDPPTCYVEDSPASIRYFLTQLLALPRGGAAASAVFGAMRAVTCALVPTGFVGKLSPTRIVIAQVPNASGKRAIHHGSTRTLVIALSKDPNAKITVLLIPDGGSQPALAIKVPTTQAAETSIAAERKALSDLRTRLPSAILPTIPALADFTQARSGPWLVTTALAGSPMTTRYHEWRHLASHAAVEADFVAVEAWLAAFQRATAGPSGPIEMDAGVNAALRARFAADPALFELLGRLGAIHARLRMTRTPRTAVHGDFWFGNLLFADGKVSGVVDWEAAASAGEPVRDLARFALTYALYIDRHTRPGHRVKGHGRLRADGWGAGVDHAIAGDGWFPDLVRSFVKRGLTRLGADPDCWREALLAGIAEVAATADHLDFARLHWRLFDRLSSHVVTAR